MKRLKIISLVVALIVLILPLLIMTTQEPKTIAIIFVLYGIILGATIITKVDKFINLKRYSKGELKFVFEQGLNHYTHNKKHSNNSINDYFNELVDEFDIPTKREP